MTGEELEAIRARVADDVVLPTATTLAIIDDLKLCRGGWSGASRLAANIALQEAQTLIRLREAEAKLAAVEKERDMQAAEAVCQMKYSVKQHEAAQAAIRGRDAAFRHGAEAMREAAAKWFMAGMFRMGGGEGIADIIRHVPIPEEK